MNSKLSPVLRRLGGNYLILVLLLIQIAWFPFIFLGTLLFWLNSGAPPVEQILPIVQTRFSTLLVLYVFFLLVMLVNSRHIIQALNRLASGQTLAADLHNKAWRQVVFLTKRHMIGSILVALAQLLFTYFNIPHVSFGSFPGNFYLLFASGTALTLATEVSIILASSLLGPVVRALQPDDFSEAVAYMRPALSYQLVAIAIGLVLTSLLALSSIGHYHTYLVLYREIGSAQVLQKLITRSFSVSLVILFISLLYIRRFTRQAFLPLRRMIAIFQKIEDGDLSQRVQVESVDEIGLLSTYFNRMIERLQALQATLEERVRIRTAQLEAVNAISQTGITVLDLEDLTQRFAAQISESFGYYLVAIYLTSENKEWVEIRAASGETGKLLLLRRQRFLINSNTAIGKALQLQKRQIIEYDEQTSSSTFLPYTRSELIFPLIVGEQMLGVLDIHATRSNAFDPETVEILQNIANQIAIAIANANAFQRMREALEELETSQRLYVKTAWEDVLTEHRELVYRVGEALKEPAENTQLLNVPISLREQILGEILIEGRELSDEDRAWVEAIATQAAVALENVRLLENSQRTALQERLVAEIIQRIWSARTIESVLKTAVRELGQALQASEATIELYADSGEKA